MVQPAQESQPSTPQKRHASDAIEEDMIALVFVSPHRCHAMPCTGRAPVRTQSELRDRGSVVVSANSRSKNAQ